MSLFPSFFGSLPQTNFNDDNNDNDSWSSINEWNPFNTDFPPRFPYNSGYPFFGSFSLPHSQFTNEINAFNPFNTDFPPRAPFNSGYPFSDSLSLPHSQFSDEINDITEAPFNRNETPETNVFSVEIPRLNKDEVKVEVEDGGVLKVRGERSRKKEEKKKWYRFKSSSGKFRHSYTLPEDAQDRSDGGFNGEWSVDCHCAQVMREN